MTSSREHMQRLRSWGTRLVRGLVVAALALVLVAGLLLIEYVVASPGEQGFPSFLRAHFADNVLHHVLLLVMLCVLGALCLSARQRQRQHRELLALAQARLADETALSENQLRLAAEVFENSIEGIVVTDAEGTIQRVNPAFTAITGYSAEEAIGQNPRILKSDRHPPEFYRDMWQRISTEGQWSGEIWNRHKSGRAFPEWLTISAITDQAGHTTSYVSVFHDLTDLKQREEEMRHLAHHDPLTGLANRLLFDDHLQLALIQARRAGSSVAVIYTDLDDFKKVNDCHGHAVGDQLLSEIGRRLAECVREEDTVARLGGDEFVILLPNLPDASFARRVMNCLAEAMAQPFVLPEHVIEASFSVGAAFFPEHGTDADTILRRADDAMYHAKAAGKNRSVVYSNDLPSDGEERSQRVARLRRGIAAEEIQVCFQPRLDLASGRWCGAEALVRWNRPEGPPLDAEHFLELAEESGLVHSIGETVLHGICDELARGQLAHENGFTVGFNLSTRELQHPQVAARIEAVLRARGVRASALEVEVSETTLGRDSKMVTTNLQALAELGIPIHVDAYAGGASSLSCLHKVPVSGLIIDRLLVARLPHEPEAVRLVAAILSVCRELELSSIAVGVENAAQREFLASRGCRRIQGDAVSPPLPAGELARLFEPASDSSFSSGRASVDAL